jgi:hypothetical protein
MNHIFYTVFQSVCLSLFKHFAGRTVCVCVCVCVCYNAILDGTFFHGSVIKCLSSCVLGFIMPFIVFVNISVHVETHYKCLCSSMYICVHTYTYVHLCAHTRVVVDMSHAKNPRAWLSKIIVYMCARTFIYTFHTCSYGNVSGTESLTIIVYMCVHVDLYIHACISHVRVVISQARM